MKPNKYLAAAAFSLLSVTSFGATWERPAGAYTPTNHSVNTTKYQTDRANGVAISSEKVDGDINKAFQGLNSLESRVSPNVVGQAGKFLTNNGSSTLWGLISSTSIGSGAATAGQVLKSNGSGSTVFGLVDTSSLANLGVAGTYSLPVITLNTAGMVSAVTTTQAISVTSLYASGSLVVSGTATISGSLSARTISGTITSSGVVRVYGSMSSTGTKLFGRGVSTTSLITTGTYGVSFTTPIANASYVANATIAQLPGCTYVPYISQKLTSGIILVVAGTCDTGFGGTNLALDFMVID